jgi:hypothetical protein
MVACEGVAFRHRKYFLCCSKFCIPRWIYQERAQIEECAYTRQIDEWAYAAYPPQTVCGINRRGPSSVST